MVVWGCQVALQTSGLVFKLWNTDIAKERRRCLKKGIPNIDRKSKSLPMHHFQNRIMCQNTIIQNKGEAKLSRKKFRTIEDTRISINLHQGTSRAIDLMS